ncbi:MAG: carbonic anhydrase [Myxococcota bacterium]
MSRIEKRWSLWLVVGFLAASMWVAPVALSKAGSTMSPRRQAGTDTEIALRLLKKGNERFVSGKMRRRDYPEEVSETADGQHPFAAIVSCLDSRIPPETIFDRGIGDLFVARIAGNFVNDDILGSLEFAVISGAQTIVILGHNRCGAVIGACNQQDAGGLLAGTLANINPAVQSVGHEHGPRDGDNPAFVQAVAEENVHLTIQKLLDRSLRLRAAVEDGSLEVVGAMYDLTTGEVEFWD